jgi:ActR/RegA family two-component response regulator
LSHKPRPAKFTEAIKLGAKNVISKPFEPDNVLNILRSL